MATVTIDDNPTISDTIVFNLQTSDANGCFTANPYQVNSVVIYFVERDFSSGNLNLYDDQVYDTAKLQAAEIAKAIACSNPTQENILAAQTAQSTADNSAVAVPFYFNEAVPVQIVGNDKYPAWITTDVANSFLTHITEDNLGNTLYGQFTYTWQPEGMREGDYFICWTWTPLIAGASMSSHTRFYLKGDTTATTSLPTHFTNPVKYTTLLERYTPEMFKTTISVNDDSPIVLDKFNNSVASGFTDLENLANQMVDLQDANSIAESLIPCLSNLFDLKLKTTDPTRWRGQIKRAVPLFKMKGTRKALAEALEQAAINLISINQLWEIKSSYTWQEVFVYDGTTESFDLSKVVVLPIDYDNFELWLRAENSNTWIPLSVDYVDFINSDGVSTMTWMGGSLSIDPIDLIAGDEIKVLYEYMDVPNPTAQTIENYIRTLPLMDQRDEKNQVYPLKNWNVRVIAANDPMFDLVVPTRNPFHDFIVYGKVRTEFPYSENIYNMEEYNGSIRNSLNPCDIDRDFIDPCTACISSSYNIDLEIDNLSDDRIAEAKEILTEYTPFHSVVQTFNFIGGFNEFVESPIEEIEILVTIKGSEIVAAGEAQLWFNRIMQDVEHYGILRDQLSTDHLVVPTTTGIAYNDSVVVFCPAKKLDDIGMSLDGSAKLQILAPSPLAGTYNVVSPVGNTVEVDLTTGQPTPGSEPINNCNNIFATNDTINSCAFTFDINNLILDGTLCNIAQDNFFIFSDKTQNFGLLGVKSLFDVEQGTATTPWSISIPAYSNNYVIQDVLPDGSLIIVNNGTLPATNTGNINYVVLDESDQSKATSTNGLISVTQRGRVTVLSSSLLPINNIIVDLATYFFKINTTDYPILGFVPSTNNQFWIANYNLGGIASANLRVDQKIIKNQIGYFSYRGMNLQMTGNLESSLGIQNGANSLVVVDQGIENSGFKENFIVMIGSDSYFMTNINGNSPSGHTTINLSGTGNYWKTLGVGGTSVNVTIYQYVKNGATVMGQQFNLPSHTFRILDRSGNEVIDATNQDGVVTGLSLPEGNEINDVARQEESITYTIQYADGTTEEGEV